MNLSNRINDLFQKYSVKLEVAEGEVPADVVAEESSVASAVLSNGTEIYVDAPAFDIGLGVYVLNEEGEQIPLPDGDYELGDGGTLSILEGVIASLETAPEAEPEAEAEVVVEAKYDEDEDEDEDKKKMSKSDKRRKDRQVRSDKRAKDFKLARQSRKELRELSKENTMLKAELKNLKALSAAKPLARRQKTKKKESLDLSKMSVEDRIFNLHNLYK